jgi:hypothetical protein
MSEEEVGVLDAFAREFYPDDDRSSTFKKTVRIVAPPILTVFLFSVYYFVFIDNDWAITSVTARIILLSLVTVFIITLSPEPMEWRLISVTAVSIIIIIDTMAQLAGFYDYPTMPGGNLQYDFVGHIFTGTLTIAVLTNVVKDAGKNIHLLFIFSIVAAIGWEFVEYGISLIADGMIKKEIESFSFVLENSIMDLIAHVIGMTIFTALFVGYKFITCPPSMRSGLLCRI